MNWMACWPGRFPVFAAEASGARVIDVDGHEFIDFCLGDTGAMTGHSPAATVAVIAEQAARGISLMLPTEDSPIVGEELARRFGLPLWQIASSATDANRFALRLARQATGRQKILVFDWCYHGTVDETLVTLDADGHVQPREGRMGPPVDPALTTVVVPFNDVDALEAALAPGDVACVLAEPAMTNIGIIHPEPGYHDALREITRRTGTLLIIDETHTICAGPGGYTRAHDLDPDLLTIGKPIASGLPTAAYGMTNAVAELVVPAATGSEGDVSGIGGTLAGNALALAAMRVTLTEVLTDAAFARTLPLGERWAAGVQAVIDDREVPWSVTRLGARAEYWFLPERPRHGAEAAAGVDEELDGFMHLYALNRGILMTPFHNMALMSPDTTEADVDRHTEVFAAAVDELLDLTSACAVRVPEHLHTTRQRAGRTSAGSGGEEEDQGKDHERDADDQDDHDPQGRRERFEHSGYPPLERARRSAAPDGCVVVRHRAQSDGEDAVLAPRTVHPLVPAHVQPVPDRAARLGRVDHVVELRVARGDVRIDVGADLLRQLELLRHPFLLGDGLERLAVDDRDRAVGPHHRDLRGRPRDDVVGLVGQAVHHEVAGAVALAQDHADLRDGRLAHREQHLGAVADDPLLLHRGADDEAGHVVEEHERDPERVAEPDEARGLVRRVHVQRAAEHHRLVRDDPDRLTTDASRAR